MRSLGVLERYVCIARLGGDERIFLWETGDRDRIVVDEAGFVRTFPTEADARAASESIQPEPATRYDLDRVEAWCTSTDATVHCSALLNAWNLFGDIPGRGDLFAIADASANGIYDKLFWGCNLPAMTPEGEHYTPVWTELEIATLKRLLMLGFAEFRARLSPMVTI